MANEKYREETAIDEVLEGKEFKLLVKDDANGYKAYKGTLGALREQFASKGIDCGSVRTIDTLINMLYGDDRWKTWSVRVVGSHGYNFKMWETAWSEQHTEETSDAASEETVVESAGAASDDTDAGVEMTEREKMVANELAEGYALDDTSFAAHCVKGWLARQSYSEYVVTLYNDNGYLIGSFGYDDFFKAKEAAQALLYIDGVGNADVRRAEWNTRGAISKRDRELQLWAMKESQD